MSESLQGRLTTSNAITFGLQNYHKAISSDFGDYLLIRYNVGVQGVSRRVF